MRKYDKEPFSKPVMNFSRRIMNCIHDIDERLSKLEGERQKIEETLCLYGLSGKGEFIKVDNKEKEKEGKERNESPLEVGGEYIFRLIDEVIVIGVVERCEKGFVSMNSPYIYNLQDGSGSGSSTERCCFIPIENILFAEER